MHDFKNSFNAIMKRPFICLFISIFVFMFTIIEHYLVFPLLAGLDKLNLGEQLEVFIFLLQMLLSFINEVKNFSKTHILFIVMFFICMISSGVIFSGYFNIVNNTVNRIGKKKGEFILGIRKNFLRITAINFTVVILTFIYIMFSVLVSVPALIVTRAALIENQDFISLAILLNFLTLVVLFFQSMFLRIYIFYWYPAAINYKSNLFRAGKYIADLEFWKIVLNISLFDIFFIIIQGILLFSNFALGGNEIVNLVLFVVNWIFKTFFFGFLSVFVFSSFARIKNNFKKDKEVF